MAKSFEIGLSYLDQLLAGAMMAQARRNSMLRQLFHKTCNQISEDLEFAKRQPASVLGAACRQEPWQSHVQDSFQDHAN